MGLGMREILVIAILILLLFGAKRIPEFMKGLGSGIKEFKKSMKEDDKENDNTEDKTTK
jgi:sec-independent protein translocase protein tatA/E homolog